MRNEPIHTFQIDTPAGPVVARLYHDEDAQPPSECADKDGAFLVAGFRRYLEVAPPKGAPTFDDVRTAHEEDADGEPERLASILEDYDVIPVYVYAHSGVTVSLAPFGCRWDSAQAAYVLVRKGQGMDAGRAAAAVVDEWRMYLDGDVYGHIVTGPDGAADSCWGFYGLEYAEQGARAAAEALAEAVTRAHKADLEAGNLPWTPATSTGDVP